MTKIIGNKPTLLKSDYNFFTINNLGCLYINNPKVVKTYVAMSVNCGSIDDTIPGLTHLLEHLLFISPDQEDENQTDKRINDFDSFLSQNNGHSNAYTDEDVTLYHYEIDVSATDKSLNLFSHFFKNPKIEESTIKNEIKVVNSEFENGKYSEIYRISRIQEILDKKKFSVGNYVSFGEDYEKLVNRAKELFKSKYKKMFLVIISNLPFNKIKESVKEKFNFSLEKSMNPKRKCLYCENDNKPMKNFTIKEIVKLKGTTEKKSIIFSIPLISENLLPFNIYNSLMFYLTKSDHSSLLLNLKNHKLIINGSIYNEIRSDKNVITFHFTVENIESYKEIYRMIVNYIISFRKKQMFISEQAQMENKIDWKLQEDDEPREHVVFCANKLLKSDILFTELIHDHECTNFYFNEISVILIDREFDIFHKKDYYDLCYEILTNNEIVLEEKRKELCNQMKNTLNIHENEKIDCKQNDMADNKLNIFNFTENSFIEEKFKKFNVKKEIFHDKAMKSTVKNYKYKENNLLFINDNLDTPEINITLFLSFNVDITDEIKIKIFAENIFILYDTLFRTNGITFSFNLYDYGVRFNITGLDPFFLLINILNKIQIDLVDHELIFKDIKASKIEFLNADGYKRVKHQIKNVYIPHHVDVNDDIKKLNLYISKKESINDFTSFFDKAEKVILIVNGTDVENNYFDVFMQYCRKIGELLPTCSDLYINEKFRCIQSIGELKDGLVKNKSFLLDKQKITAKSVIKAKNRAFALFFKIGKGNKSDALCKLISHALNEKFFTKLRTEMGLGYIVFVDIINIKGNYFVTFIVQSHENAIPQIIEFIQTENYEIINVQTLKNQIMAEQLSRFDFNEHYFNLLYSEHNLHEYQIEICNIIDTITESDLKTALQNAEISYIESECFQNFE